MKRDDPSERLDDTVIVGVDPMDNMPLIGTRRQIERPNVTEFMANAAKAEASMNYPRCATCKWWGRPDETPDKSWFTEGFRICFLMSVREHDYVKRYISEIGGLAAEQAYERAVDADAFMDISGSESDVSIGTAPNFGCVQHEPFDERETAP